MKEPAGSNSLLVILGPTASGKTRLAVGLAGALNAEIISADSRQIFKGMDIGTGKDLSEYTHEGRRIPYHLIDIKASGDKYHVDEFKNDFFRIYEDLKSREVLPILCGGTGMYIHSVLKNHVFTSIPPDHGLREQLSGLSLSVLNDIVDKFPLQFREHADRSTIKRMIRAIEVATFLSSNNLNVVQRPPMTSFVVGLIDDVETRREKIRIRLNQRLNGGMVEEVEGLLRSGVPAEMLHFYGLEYKIVVSYLQQSISFAEMKEQLYNGICQYAKRQMTFFRKMEKDGVYIHWYQANTDREDLIDKIKADFRNEIANR